MVACLCSCARTDHYGGDGRCACGCPMWRPMTDYTAEDEAHDLQHDATVRAHLEEHTLVREIVEVEDGVGIWLTLPDLAGEPEGIAWAEQQPDPGEES